MLPAYKLSISILAILNIYLSREMLDWMCIPGAVLDKAVWLSSSYSHQAYVLAAHS